MNSESGYIKMSPVNGGFHGSARYDRLWQFLSASPVTARFMRLHDKENFVFKTTSKLERKGWEYI